MLAVTRNKPGSGNKKIDEHLPGWVNQGMKIPDNDSGRILDQNQLVFSITKPVKQTIPKVANVPILIQQQQRPRGRLNQPSKTVLPKPKPKQPVKKVIPKQPTHKPLVT